MDIPSQHVAAFLEMLQDRMTQLGHAHGHFASRGNRPATPFLVLSGRPFSIGSERQFHGRIGLGLHVKGADDRE